MTRGDQAKARGKLTVRNRARAWLAGVAARLGLLAAASVAFPAAAQPGGGGFGMGFGGGDFGGPPMSTRDLEQFVSILGLSPDQKSVAETLMNGYLEQYRAQSDAFRQAMETARSEFRDTQDPAVWEEVRKSGEALRATRTKIEADFNGDVQAILTADQAARWPVLDRTLRRERTLRMGRMSGERVDVVRLVRDAGLAPAAMDPLAPVLDQYAVDLDRELVKRNQYIEEMMPRMGELFRSRDMEAAQKMLEEARDNSVRVRDVNRRYARQVEALMPEEARAPFASAVRSASYPDIYRQTYAGRVVAAAVAFADLDEAQRDQLAALSASFDRDVAGLNERLAAATEDWEQTVTVEQMFQRFGGADDNSPLGDLRRQKRDLERSTIEAVRKVLRPDQAEKLPARDQEDGQQRDRFRGGGGGRAPDSQT